MVQPASTPSTPAAPQPVDPDALLLRIADQVGLTPDDIRTSPRTTKWSSFEVGRPLPGDLGKVYTVIAIFYGARGREEDRTPEEQRVYAFPRVANIPGQGVVPYLRLTYVPGRWGNEGRHEQMDVESFVDEIAADFRAFFGVDDEDGDECVKCGDVISDEDFDFCPHCGAPVPEGPEMAVEAAPPAAS